MTWSRRFPPRLLLVVVLAVWPLAVHNAYALSVMTTAALSAGIVLSLNLLTGQAGQLSFGHTAFAGVGAYTAAILTMKAHLPSLLALVIAAAAAGVVALIVGRPVLRLRFFFLAVATIGLGQIFYVLVSQSRSVAGGTNGLAPVPYLNIFGFSANSYLRQYYVVWVLLFLVLFFTQRALRSRAGRAFRALSASEVAASTLGVRTANWKLLVFVISATYCGVSGALFAFTLSAVNPNDFSFWAAIPPMIMMLLGGAQSLWGGLVGAIIMTWVGRGFTSYPQYSGLFYAVILLLLLLFLPGGLAAGLRPAHRQKLQSLLSGSRRLGNRRPVAESAFSAVAYDGEGGTAGVVPVAASAPGSLPTNECPLREKAPSHRALLEIEHVSVSFGGLTAVNDVSFTVHEGEIAAVIGPNGAGKTTLFNAVSRLQRTVAGAIRMAGTDVTHAHPADVARLGLARTFQNLRLFENMSVLENVMAGRHRHEHAGFVAAGLGLPGHRREEQQSRRRALEILEMVGLSGREDRPASSLPYGQQRLVEIGRAIASEPVLLLLDEPAAGMNASEKTFLMDRIRAIREAGVTVLLVEHDIEMVMGLCDQVTVLDHGSLIAQGTAREIQQDPKVIEAYLGAQRKGVTEQESVPAGGRTRVRATGVGESMTRMPIPLLELCGVSTSYGAIDALRDVSVRVEEGEIVAVLGGNGAGKTTLMHTVSGILRPRSGHILLRGEDITSRASARIAAKGVCQVPEGRRVFHSLSVKDNLLLGASAARGRTGRSGELDYVYDLFPILAQRRDQPAGTLSGGEQQMLAIGRALMGRPILLLLDEPSMGLAPLAVERIFEALAKLNGEGLAMLMVEQNARMALATADRAVVLQTGEVTLSGTAEELMCDDRVRRVYLGQSAQQKVRVS